MADTHALASARSAGTFDIGGDLTVNRLGFGAMRITGDGIWGEPRDPAECSRVLRRAVELDVNLIDTADSYGPEVSERLIADALYPYPEDLVIATKGGLTRSGPNQWHAKRPSRAPAPGLRGQPGEAAPRANRPLPAPSRRPGGAAGGVARRADRAPRRGQDRAHRPVERLGRASSIARVR